MAGAASLRGAALTLAGAALWGFSGASSQYVLAQGADPTFVTAMRMLCAGALFLAFLAVRRRDVLARVFADRATVLQMTGSVFIMLFVCLRARTAPRTGEALGLAAALAATYLIATQGDFGALRLPVEGVLWGVANGLAVALYVVYPKESGLFERFGGLATTGLGMAVGAVYATIVWLVRAIISLAAGDGAEALRIVAPPLDASGWAVLAIGVGVVGTFVAYALYLSGVARVGSVAGGLLGAVEPLAATSLSAVWLGTAFSGADWAGFALMLAMIALVTIKGPKARTDAAGKGADQAG